MILYRFPFTGLLRELLSIGLLELIKKSGIQLIEKPGINEEVAETLINICEDFEKNLSGVGSSKIVLNDKNAYFNKTQRLVKWYGKTEEIPEDYLQLMFYTLRGTSKLLKKNKVNFIQSLQNVSIGREIVLGNKYNNSLAIVPAVIKQAEFYEHQHEFLKPTAGREPEILLDPIWFTLMAIGFLKCFSGYYDKKYHFITKEGVESILDNPELTRIISDAISYVAEAHIRKKPLPYCEELYELTLSHDIALGGKAISPLAYPLKLYEITLIGNAYTCINTMLIDLTDSVSYLNEYINRLRSVGILENVQVKIREEVYESPIHALLEIANRELKSTVEGDNAMLTLIFVKDLYRAIHVRRIEFVEETLLRLLRTAQAVLSTRSGISMLLREALKAFINHRHVEILLSIGSIIEA
ncbi:MAG: type I-A CRISPR-associated protein Cas8a2/Csx9 [bacterium]|nr:type I-A CRISPR-associated protein Cas8a2/Csx9 [bacterium]MDW7986991.1 type I-A CRISPR-associated protein Cas8a2/Csx9 [Nitrososphaerota archaeon]